jgi:hypothetical protein
MTSAQIVDEALETGALYSSACGAVRIPTEAGGVFRREAGHRSDLKPAT